MDSRLPQDVADLADAATRRLKRLGGVEAARRAEADPASRYLGGEALHELGSDELDVRADPEQLLAGAVLCRAVGATALPWPIIPELLRLNDGHLVLIDESFVRVDHGSLDLAWVGAKLDGTAWTLNPTVDKSAGRLGPFVVSAVLDAPKPTVSSDDIARYLTLQAWTILGAVESAVAEIVEHVRTRHQFGQALSEFQVVRFTMADATIALRGLEQLAKFTTWRQSRGDEQQRLADAMALRLHAADVAVHGLRTAHQFYGALGFCDETDLSVLDRHLQPTLRYPLSAERLAAALVPSVRSRVLTAQIA